MDIDLRMDKYDFHYQFRKEPLAFNWSFHPERIVIRNEALRTNNRELYERYVKAVFPTYFEQEMKAFDRTLTGLKQVSGQQARLYFETHTHNMVQSDIYWEEEDAIFFPRFVPEHELEVLIEDEELILNKIHTDWITDRKLLWLDTIGSFFKA